jgi:hypothetical protein
MALKINLGVARVSGITIADERENENAKSSIDTRFAARRDFVARGRRANRLLAPTPMTLGVVRQRPPRGLREIIMVQIMFADFDFSGDGSYVTSESRRTSAIPVCRAYIS